MTVLYERDGWTIDTIKKMDVLADYDVRYEGVAPDGRRYVGLSMVSDNIWTDLPVLYEVLLNTAMEDLGGTNGHD